VPDPPAGIAATAHGRPGPLLRVQSLVKHFPVNSAFGLGRGRIEAVAGVSFDLTAGETLGIVGESGCGKSTLARLVLRLEEPTGGSIWFDGQEITRLGDAAMRPIRAGLQVVFQDPRSSLDPRLTIETSLLEPLEVHGAAGGSRRTRVRELLQQVGLNAADAHRLPHEFSGGQQQRVALARALALNPKLLILDEPTSSLDVSIRAQVVNLLLDLQAELGLSYLFISHDLSLVHHISSRIAVMYLGKIVETAPADDLYARPLHPYTAALLSAVPVPDPRLERERRRVVLPGAVPSAANPPTGCRFHTRCPLAPIIAQRRPGPTATVEGRTLPAACVHEEPALVACDGRHWAACHFADESAQEMAS
jgi:peptide/nickel transport system ATP-binding protein/oligopeptide transport system ATP-binding protein